MSLVALRRSSAGRPVRDLKAFLPTTREEMDARGWDELDVLIVTGDAYVDHPAFGPVLVARFLAGRGLRVGIVAQPRWTDPADIARMGRPRLFVGVSAGNLDSMLNKLTAQKKMRSDDNYSPGGRPNMRPNRATIVYSNLCRQAFPGLPVVLGGIEASLRRIAHYDYWSDSVRRSVLLDSKADLLVFGMGEFAAWRSRGALGAAGETVDALTDVRGTAHVKPNRRGVEEVAADPSRYVTDGKPVLLPSYEEVRADKQAFARMSKAFQYETNAHNGRPLLQAHGDQAVYFNPPSLPLAEAEMDSLYDLPFARRPHWAYEGERNSGVRHHQALDRHDARLLRRVHVLQHHRARGADHPEPKRRQRPARGARPHAAGGLPRHHHRRRRPDGQHVQDDVQGRHDRARLPPPVVRAPRHLREPRHRPRAARRAAPEGAVRAGGRARLRGERRALRPRRP